MKRLQAIALLAAGWLILTGAAWADDPGLEPPAVNTAPDEKYDDDKRPFQGIPGIERAPKGRLWATWYSGGNTEGGENYVLLVTSDDDGKTWSAPKLVLDVPGPVRTYDPALWVDPLGRLWLFWAQSFEWWDGRSGTWAIVTSNPDDESPSWTAPKRIADGIMMNKPTVTKSRNWLLPISIWNRPTKMKDASRQHDIAGRHGAYAVASTDQGATFQPQGKASTQDASFDEHMIVEKNDGSLWMLIRTKSGIAEATSTDGGKSWSEAIPSKIPHIDARFFIRRLASGKLLLVRHNPPEGSKKRSHLSAYLSDDDGKTWSGGLLIDERAGVSYPDGFQHPDGTIAIIYDFDRTGDKNILMATFTEEDIQGGKFASPTARQRVLINRATAVNPLNKAKK